MTAVAGLDTCLTGASAGATEAGQRALLTRVHEVYPREVIETSPGTYVWRRAG